MLYPIMTETRQVIDLSGLWRFKLDTNDDLQEELALEPINEKRVILFQFPLLIMIYLKQRTLEIMLDGCGMKRSDSS